MTLELSKYSTRAPVDAKPSAKGSDYNVRLPRAVGEDQLDASGLKVTFVDGSPVGVSTRRLRWHFVAKRAIDLVSSGSALLALSPVFATIALLIKLDDGGPVLFRQKRVGLHGELFDVYKFRTMYCHVCDPSGASMTKKNDMRVTRIGKFLRKTSLDELPQLFNIFRGSMSVVGPRPHVPGQKCVDRPIGDCVPYYDHRHVARPGLTGWAQANGFRGPTDRVEDGIGRVNHDLAYIQNFSIWLDIRTVWRTVWREFLSGTGF